MPDFFPITHKGRFWTVWGAEIVPNWLVYHSGPPLGVWKRVGQVEELCAGAQSARIIRILEENWLKTWFWAEIPSIFVFISIPNKLFDKIPFGRALGIICTQSHSFGWLFARKTCFSSSRNSKIDKSMETPRISKSKFETFHRWFTIDLPPGFSTSL